ncbi:phosphotransferase family protein [Shouchella sp. JSM 1781072]|uniref:phosphotransferase family protein n=1 Tax=Shouchella sp. JSM 1781072 TaxID=3344581 RepID=UPI0035BEFC90
MNLLEERLASMNFKIIALKEIKGLYAGKVYRIHVLSDSQIKQSFIYKELAQERNNEISIYNSLSPYLKDYFPLIKIWQNTPQAILMNDLGDSVKISWKNLNSSTKVDQLRTIIQSLISIHSINPDIIKNNSIVDHRLTKEWQHECTKNLLKLANQVDWVKEEWFQLIEQAYNQLELFTPSILKVITHGDPHLENIFYNNGKVKFIDWEWVAMSSPLRDITILLQDIYELNIIDKIILISKELLNKEGLNMTSLQFNTDFYIFYSDHLAMMMSWEIEKFFFDLHTEQEIKNILDFKMIELQRINYQMNDLS